MTTLALALGEIVQNPRVGAQVADALHKGQALLECCRRLVQAAGPVVQLPNLIEDSDVIDVVAQRSPVLQGPEVPIGSGVAVPQTILADSQRVLDGRGREFAVLSCADRVEVCERGAAVADRFAVPARDSQRLTRLS